MSIHLVDARGQPCPKPLIMTKKALAALAPGEPLTVRIDDATSRQNVERFLADSGIVFSTEEKEGVFEIRVTAAGAASAQARPEPPRAPQPAGAHVVCIANDRMGHGDDRLGAILIKAFVNTLSDVTPLPGAIVFYNAGVKLVLDDSPVLDALEELAAAGVRILACGTCVDYYDVKERVRVGTISNMYAISETLIGARSVIYP